MVELADASMSLHTGMISRLYPNDRYCTRRESRLHIVRCATQKHAEPFLMSSAEVIPQAERSRRHRVGVAARLDAIQAELAERGARIERQLAALTVRLDLASQLRQHEGSANDR